MNNWEKLSLKAKSELMSIYLKNGITSLDEMKKHYNSFAEGGFTSPDHDPNNPYHYHVNGQKVVVTPEDWEKYKDDPTFREVRAAIEAEQAAHPGPEYDEIENPAWRTAYQRIGVSNPNYWNGSKYVLSPLPQGYSRDERGIVIDANDNYYAPVKDMSYSNPNVPFFMNNERSMVNGNTVPVRYEQVQMPAKTIRQLRQPLPVDRVINVDTEKDKSISDYQKNNKVFTLENIFEMDDVGHAPGEVPLPLGSKLDWNNIYEGDNLNIFSDAFTKIFGRNIKVKDLGNKRYHAKFVVNLSEEEVNTLRKEIKKRTGRELRAKLIPIQPSRQEAEKKAVISIGDLEKVGTLAKGGKLDTPPERFFGIATPEVTDNTVYQPTYGTLLPKINITTKGNPRKVNNDYYKAHSRARADLQYKVQTAPGWQLATLGAALPAAFMLAPTILPATGKVLANPLVDAALTTHGAITAPKNIVEGVNEIKEGNYGKGALNLGLTALDLIGAGNLIGRPARLLSKNFRRNLAYRTIFPYDYSFSPKDAKDILKGIWNKQYSPKDIQHVHENHPLRAAAFRKYLGLEDDITKKLFVPRSDGTFNIDPEVAIELNKNVGINTLTGSPLQNLYKGYKRDNIYDIMGGLGGSEVYSLGNRGVFRMTDTWDLQPFKKFEGSPRVRLANDIENLGTKIRQHTYDKSLLKPIDKLAEKMQYAGDYVKADKSANSWLRNFEVGPILGGKPFNIDARIPININGGFPIYNPIANIPSLEQAIMTKGDKVVFRRVKEPFEQFANGGPIHIKPENRGKFTALKKRTGHSASWFKEHGTPAQKKMAVFELNSRKWRK